MLTTIKFCHLCPLMYPGWAYMWNGHAAPDAGEHHGIWLKLSHSQWRRRLPPNSLDPRWTSALSTVQLPPSQAMTSSGHRWVGALSLPWRPSLTGQVAFRIS